MSVKIDLKAFIFFEMNTHQSAGVPQCTRVWGGRERRACSKSFAYAVPRFLKKWEFTPVFDPVASQMTKGGPSGQPSLAHWSRSASVSLPSLRWSNSPDAPKTTLKGSAPAALPSVRLSSVPPKPAMPTGKLSGSF